MRNFTFLILFFAYITMSFAQNQIEEDKDQEKINEQSKKHVEENEKEAIQTLAIQRATELQKELNLTNYTSQIVRKAIIHYSIKANKIIQSNLSANEKTKSLSNLVYFQNEELKEVLTVSQFYQYLKLNNYAVN